MLRASHCERTNSKNSVETFMTLMLLAVVTNLQFTACDREVLDHLDMR